MLKKLMLAGSFVFISSQLNIHNSYAAELNHGILQKDGSITEANVNPHYDILEIEKPLNLIDATKNSQQKNKLDHGILQKDGSITEANVNPHYDILEIEKPMNLIDATKDSQQRNKRNQGNPNQSGSSKDGKHDIAQIEKPMNLIDGTKDHQQRNKNDQGAPRKTGSSTDVNVYTGYNKVKDEKSVNITKNTKLPETGKIENNILAFVPYLLLLTGGVLVHRGILAYKRKGN